MELIITLSKRMAMKTTFLWKNASNKAAKYRSEVYCPLALNRSPYKYNSECHRSTTFSANKLERSSWPDYSCQSIARILSQLSSILQFSQLLWYSPRDGSTLGRDARTSEFTHPRGDSLSTCLDTYPCALSSYEFGHGFWWSQKWMGGRCCV
jgi:hypothetical protein